MKPPTNSLVCPNCRGTGKYSPWGGLYEEPCPDCDSSDSERDPARSSIPPDPGGAGGADLSIPIGSASSVQKGAPSILDPLVRRVRFQRFYLRLFDLSEAANEPARAARLLVLSLAAYRRSVGTLL
jgi:hypothetical protein